MRSANSGLHRIMEKGRMQTRWVLEGEAGSRRSGKLGSRDDASRPSREGLKRARHEQSYRTGIK